MQALQSGMCGPQDRRWRGGCIDPSSSPSVADGAPASGTHGIRPSPSAHRRPAGAPPRTAPL